MNYEILKKQLVNEINLLINEYSNSKNVICNNNLPKNYLDFSNNKLYIFICDEIKNIFNRKIREIFLTLFKEKNNKITIFNVIMENKKVDINNFFSFYKNQPLFSFLIKYDKDNSFQLCMVKEFGINKKISEEVLNICINSIMNKLQINITNYFYLSEVDSLAYTEQFNFIQNPEDESNGTNIYSMGNYIKSEFGDVEYYKFNDFISYVNNYLKNNFGYSIIKNLIPNSLFGYKKDLETKLKTFDYLKEILLFNSSFNNYEMLFSRYENFFSFIISDKNFSISFITSEWLYDSLNKNAGIDLTTITMGYLKSIEQLLSYIMFLFVNHGLIIPFYKNNTSNDIKYEKELTKKYYKNKINKLTLQNIKDFYKYEKNINLYYTDSDISSKNIFFKLLDNIHVLRNEYFHKKNLTGEKGITDVKQIRSNTFLLLYFIFSITNFNEYQINKMSIKTKNNYDKLCEYVNYNHNYLYYITFNNNKTIVTIGQPDKKITFDKNGNAMFSGLYFCKYNNVSPSKQILSLEDINNINKEAFYISSIDSILKIEIGNIKPCAEGIKLSGPIEVLYENNLFFK